MESDSKQGNNNQDQEPDKNFDDVYYDHFESNIELIEVMIVVNRPSNEELDSYNRAEKYKILRGNHVHHQQEISSWITVNGYQEMIKIIDQPTAFNILFARLPADLVSSLQEAPGIIEVTQVDDFDVDPLTKHSENKSTEDKPSNKYYPDKSSCIY